MMLQVKRTETTQPVCLHSRNAFGQLTTHFLHLLHDIGLHRLLVVVCLLMDVWHQVRQDGFIKGRNCDEALHPSAKFTEQVSWLWWLQTEQELVVLDDRRKFG